MTIEYASQFKKDFRTVSRGRHRKRVEAELKEVLPLGSGLILLPRHASEGWHPFARSYPRAELAETSHGPQPSLG